MFKLTTLIECFINLRCNSQLCLAILASLPHPYCSGGFCSEGTKYRLTDHDD